MKLILFGLHIKIRDYLDDAKQYLINFRQFFYNQQLKRRPTNDIRQNMILSNSPSDSEMDVIGSVAGPTSEDVCRINISSISKLQSPIQIDKSNTNVADEHSVHLTPSDKIQNACRKTQGGDINVQDVSQCLQHNIHNLLTILRNQQQVNSTYVDIDKQGSESNQKTLDQHQNDIRNHNILQQKSSNSMAENKFVDGVKLNQREQFSNKSNVKSDGECSQQYLQDDITQRKPVRTQQMDEFQKLVQQKSSSLMTPSAKENKQNTYQMVQKQDDGVQNNRHAPFKDMKKTQLNENLISNKPYNNLLENQQIQFKQQSMKDRQNMVDVDQPTSNKSSSDPNQINLIQQLQKLVTQLREQTQQKQNTWQETNTNYNEQTSYNQNNQVLADCRSVQQQNENINDIPSQQQDQENLDPSTSKDEQFDDKEEELNGQIQQQQKVIGEQIATLLKNQLATQLTNPEYFEYIGKHFQKFNSEVKKGEIPDKQCLNSRNESSNHIDSNLIDQQIGQNSSNSKFIPQKLINQIIEFQQNQLLILDQNNLMKPNQNVTQFNQVSDSIPKSTNSRFRNDDIRNQVSNQRSTEQLNKQINPLQNQNEQNGLSQSKNDDGHIRCKSTETQMIKQGSPDLQTLTEQQPGWVNNQISHQTAPHNTLGHTNKQRMSHGGDGKAALSLDKYEQKQTSSHHSKHINLEKIHNQPYVEDFFPAINGKYHQTSQHILINDAAHQYLNPQLIQLVNSIVANQVLKGRVDGGDGRKTSTLQAQEGQGVEGQKIENEKGDLLQTILLQNHNNIFKDQMIGNLLASHHQDNRNKSKDSRKSKQSRQSKQSRNSEGDTQTQRFQQQRPRKAFENDSQSHDEVKQSRNSFTLNQNQFGGFQSKVQKHNKKQENILSSNSGSIQNNNIYNKIHKFSPNREQGQFKIQKIQVNQKSMNLAKEASSQPTNDLKGQKAPNENNSICQEEMNPGQANKLQGIDTEWLEQLLSKLHQQQQICNDTNNDEFNRQIDNQGTKISQTRRTDWTEGQHRDMKYDMRNQTSLQQTDQGPTSPPKQDVNQISVDQIKQLTDELGQVLPLSNQKLSPDEYKQYESNLKKLKDMLFEQHNQQAQQVNKSEDKVREEEGVREQREQEADSEKGEADAQKAPSVDQVEQQEDIQSKNDMIQHLNDLNKQLDGLNALSQSKILEFLQNMYQAKRLQDMILQQFKKSSMQNPCMSGDKLVPAQNLQQNSLPSNRLDYIDEFRRPSTQKNNKQIHNEFLNQAEKTNGKSNPMTTIDPNVQKDMIQKQKKHLQDQLVNLQDLFKNYQSMHMVPEAQIVELQNQKQLQFEDKNGENNSQNFTNKANQHAGNDNLVTSTSAPGAGLMNYGNDCSNDKDIKQDIQCLKNLEILQQIQQKQTEIKKSNQRNQQIQIQQGHHLTQNQKQSNFDTKIINKHQQENNINSPSMQINHQQVNHLNSALLKGEKSAESLDTQQKLAIHQQIEGLKQYHYQQASNQDIEHFNYKNLDSLSEAIKNLINKKERGLFQQNTQQDVNLGGIGQSIAGLQCVIMNGNDIGSSTDKDDQSNGLDLKKLNENMKNYIPPRNQNVNKYGLTGLNGHNIYQSLTDIKYNENGQQTNGLQNNNMSTNDNLHNLLGMHQIKQNKMPVMRYNGPTSSSSGEDLRTNKNQNISQQANDAAKHGQDSQINQKNLNTQTHSSHQGLTIKSLIEQVQQQQQNQLNQHMVLKGLALPFGQDQATDIIGHLNNLNDQKILQNGINQFNQSNHVTQNLHQQQAVMSTSVHANNLQESIHNKQQGVSTANFQQNLVKSHVDQMHGQNNSSQIDQQQQQQVVVLGKRQFMDRDDVNQSILPGGQSGQQVSKNLMSISKDGMSGRVLSGRQPTQEHQHGITDVDLQMLSGQYPNYNNQLVYDNDAGDDQIDEDTPMQIRLRNQIKMNQNAKQFKQIRNELFKAIKNEKDLSKIIIKAKPKRPHHNMGGDNFRGSRFRGVSKNKNKWQMMIMINQKKVYIGAIQNENDAAKYYDHIAIISQGLGAKTNFKYNGYQIKQILNEYDFESSCSGENYSGYNSISSDQFYNQNLYGNKAQKNQIGCNQQQMHHLMQGNMILGAGHNFNPGLIQLGKRSNNSLHNEILSRQIAFKSAQSKLMKEEGSSEENLMIGSQIFSMNDKAQANQVNDQLRVKQVLNVHGPQKSVVRMEGGANQFTIGDNKNAHNVTQNQLEHLQQLQRLTQMIDMGQMVTPRSQEQQLQNLKNIQFLQKQDQMVTQQQQIQQIQQKSQQIQDQLNQMIMTPQNQLITSNSWQNIYNYANQLSKDQQQQKQSKTNQDEQQQQTKGVCLPPNQTTSNNSNSNPSVVLPVVPLQQVNQSVQMKPPDLKQQNLVRIDKIQSNDMSEQKIRIQKMLMKNQLVLPQGNQQSEDGYKIQRTNVEKPESQVQSINHLMVSGEHFSELANKDIQLNKLMASGVHATSSNQSKKRQFELNITYPSVAETSNHQQEQQK